jgi:hypothetical protein
MGKQWMRKCCYQTSRSKQMVTNLPTEFAQVFLDSRLQMNSCVQAARWTADADHQAKGTKERYDLQRKEKH